MIGGIDKEINNDNLDLKPVKSTSKKFIDLKFPDISVAQCMYQEGPVGLTIKFNDLQKCILK